MARLKDGLREGNDVTKAPCNAGGSLSGQLREQARSQLGLRPASYGRGGTGARISYTIVDCALGRLLIAATELGVCYVAFGDSDSEIEGHLHREYPAAEIRRDESSIRDWTQALLEHLDGNQPCLDVPIDITGTEFQRRVWEALASIPYGSTRSYSEVAQSVGQPHAVRAVGRACGANPVSIVVPCHRVVRKDGGLGGYGWGLERKRALLERERSMRATT